VVVPISEVVDVIPGDRVYSVVHSSLVSSLACSSEICFQGWSASVKVAHDVSVVCPAFSEYILELRWELLKRRSFHLSVARSRNQVETLKLFVSYLSAKHALNDIGPIKTVHAVGPH
jgi:hypothetical protein